MREILFRGKNYKGEWLYGSLQQWYDTFGGDIKSQIHPVELEPTQQGGRVDSTTIGQFTGLVDRNGKRIFEGDILQWVDEDNTCEGTKLIFIVKFDGEYEGFFGEGEFDNIEPWQFRNHEVIGNIHDNKMEDIK